MSIRCKDAIEVGINEIADGPNKPDLVGSRLVHRNCFEKDRNYFEKELPGNWHIIHEQAFYNKNDKSTRSCRICGEEFELEVRLSGTPISATGSLGSATGRVIPPPKPPAPRLKDGVNKILAISGKVYPFIKLLEWVWERIQPHVQPFLGRKRQPVAATQV